MSDPLKPEIPLLLKLGAIVVYADEFLSETGSNFDLRAIEGLLRNEDVQQWIKDMRVFLPLKR